MTGKEVEGKFQDAGIRGHALSEMLLEVLLQQGVLTQEQAREIREKTDMRSETFLEEMKL